MKFPQFNPFKYLHFPAFLASFTVGIFLVYLCVPKKKEIFVYPTPDNIDVLIYKDLSDGCFAFEAKEMKCPTDKSLIESIPVQ